MARGEVMVDEIVEGRERNRDNILSQAALPDLKPTNANYNRRSFDIWHGASLHLFHHVYNLIMLNHR